MIVEANNTHHGPTRLTKLPAELVAELDGDHLQFHAGDAIRLSTVGEDGWPHGAQLSFGEIIAVNRTELLAAIWPKSRTTENLKRDGRHTLTIAFGGGLLEMRCRAALIGQHLTALDLSAFRITIESVDDHRSAYADVLSGVTFRLSDPVGTITRWREQIVALKSLL